MLAKEDNLHTATNNENNWKLTWFGDRLKTGTYSRIVINTINIM